ncbi:MAG: 7-cyano-7-deazaguanine synthase QueC [Gammaproteobacteria bacterium]|uniref:7-cyano-7-deazaguanine synthase n=1 Tax=Candidatus Thiopontia autotrophica TaxID=2841688 RepID=A0A8J6P7Z4_9GAMM|nr:7-cyano-7-deazaguanine synthase QueC [Candidatus Thiopontia autotrophica]MBL6969684.1 7-cyano-7-deazaguanine synthase QueC [Gammaproteobacteria bacterium]
MIKRDEKRAVVLVSGGLDSATVLALAKSQGYSCYAISFDYGQRHHSELDAARVVAESGGAVEHKVINIGLGEVGGSALTDDSIAIPTSQKSGIPVTYVPARNLLFLSFALGWAEVLEARDIFIGVNAVDYSGYPDCRPAFIESFQQTANLATKAGDDGYPVTVHAPLIELTKAKIIRVGIELGVDYSKTVSCYQADERGMACGECDSCRLRRAGFMEAGIDDPTRYGE